MKRRGRRGARTHPGDGLEIIGKYLGIWVTHNEVEAIFGFDLSSPAKVFMLGGRVLGEARGVGLWIQLEVVSIGATPGDVFADLPKEKPRRLVRWEFIRAAEVFEDPHDIERVVGFRPRAA